MRLATWNVNSIRAREARLLDWLARSTPDVVCLQETKVTDEEFPLEPIRALGYQVALWGQRTYNGVAILSRTPLEQVERGLDGDDTDDHARFLTATVRGIRVISAYFPNGRTPEDEKYAYKKRWLERLLRQLDGRLGGDLVLAGDFNIAPEERDVNRLEEWRNSVLFNPEMSAYFRRLLDLGLVDTFRMHEAAPGFYSWWDYRMLGFPKNNGLRIDHILASTSLAPRCTRAWIERDMRKGAKPSDHTVVWAEFSP